MEILSKPILDRKINSYNVMTQMSISEYYELVKESVKKNELQRPRVRSSKSIYANLKEDLRAGCIIPPIVLSLYSEQDVSKLSAEELKRFINDNREHVFILDGLQRTYTIQDLLSESQESNDTNTIIRVEIYLGLNREGVLYRMLTLNTGQTPMSLRHQIEIIYLDLLDNQNEYGLKFIRDTEKKPKENDGYYFSEAIDAFTSYVSQDYLQITREKLLSTIESFDNLSNLKNDKDAFLDLMYVYSCFLNKMTSALNGIDVKEMMSEYVSEHLFGESTLGIFNKSQPLTGYAAAIAKLIRQHVYESIKDVADTIEGMNDDDLRQGVIDMLCYMDDIRRSAKKIGNAQRCFLYYYFKSLFDKENEETFLNCVKSIAKAKQNYERDN